MSNRKKFFATLAVFVCLFYALESYLVFRASGFTLPLLSKLAICYIAGWYAWSTFRASKSVTTGGGGAA